MIKSIITSALAILSGIAFAADIKYPASAIPANLKTNACAVLRDFKDEITITDGGKYTRHVYWAITVLNENGQDYACFEQYYDKTHKISNIKAIVYNEAGEKVKKIGSDDIIDQSAISGYSVYDDNRVKYIRPAYRTVPYTVEYSYEETQAEGFYYPSWSPIIDDYIPTEKSQFIINTTAPENLQYKELNFTNQIQFRKENAEQVTSLHWEATNIPANIPEPYSPSYKETQPLLLVAPSTFLVSGYSGNISSWEQFGKFIYSLNKDRQQLPETTRNEVLQLINDCPDIVSKVKKLYEYMQKKTRYVSIQIGIGGYQPFPAETVDRLGYGDCKALSNYMKSLLDIAQIPSNYVLINAGSKAPPVINSFPSTQFNHATLCVPLATDTLWLECTSQIAPCGFIGDFTDDRYALIVDSINSKLVRTKAYKTQDNISLTHSTIQIEGSSDAMALITSSNHGLFYDDMSSLMHVDEKDKEKAICNRLQIPSFHLQSYQLNENKNMNDPVIDMNLQVVIRNLVTPMGSKSLLQLNPINRIDKLPKPIKNRKNRMEIRRPTHESDTITFQLGNEWLVDKLPAPVVIESKFGTYTSGCHIDQQQLIYTRNLKINNGSFDPADYDAYREFLEKIMSADQSKCILAPSTSALN